MKTLYCFLSLVLSLSSFADNLQVPQNLEDISASSNIQKLYPSFADIVEPLMPAVVNIQIEYKGKLKNKTSKQTPIPEQFFSDNFFDFFEQQFSVPFMLEEPKYIGNGSGFIIDEAGFIVTNYHVVANADLIKIKLLDNTEYHAKLIGSDPKTDLALLKIDSKVPLTVVKFGASNKARVGDWIIAIGNQFGLGGTVTTGIISFKGRDIDIDVNVGGVINNFLQTDAAINKGNSGGPMFNLQGEVIGVNTAIYSPSPSGIGVGIGFAIPSDTVQKIIEELKKHGEIVRGTLDITIQEITEEIAEALSLKNSFGVLVAEVLLNGAGEKAGLKSGDVITNFAGKKIANSRELQILVAETPVNQEIVIGVIRAGVYIELKAKIIKVENVKNKNTNDIQENLDTSNTNTIQKQGIIFSDITSALIQDSNLPQNFVGIIITKIEKNQKSYGLQVGDMVLKANQMSLKNVDTFNAIYENARLAKKKNIMLLIKRRNITLYLVFPVL